MRPASFPVWLQIVLAALLLVAAGLVSGHLSIFADTTAYVRQGEYWAQKLHLAAPLAPPPPGADWSSLMPQTIAARGEGAAVAAASRSPVYGLFLYLGAALGGLKLVVAAQALVVAGMLRLVTRVCLPAHAGRAYWILVPILAATSSLPFFVDFAMPDVFSGLAILSAVLLLTQSDRLRRMERVAIWSLMLFGLLVHAANPPVLFLLMLVGVAMLMMVRTSFVVVVKRGGAVLAGIGLSLLIPALIQAAYQRQTGIAQGSPPFIMARLLADGPGRTYLEAHCPGGASPTLCQFMDRSMDDADSILWDTNADGIVAASPPPVRRRLKAEEAAFALAVLRADPVGVVAAASRNFLGQLAAVWVDDPLADPGRYRVRENADIPAMDHLIPGLAACRTSGGCQELPTLRMVDLLFDIHAPVLIVSLVVVVWLAIARPAQLDGLRATGALVFSSLIINAAVCGALSGVFARYQARLIWLLPMMAVLGVVAVVFNRPSRQTPTMFSRGGARTMVACDPVPPPPNPSTLRN